MLWPAHSRPSRMSMVLPTMPSKGDAEPGRMRMSARVYQRSSILTPLPHPLVRLTPPLTGAGSTALAHAIHGICTMALPSKPPLELLSPSELDTVSALLLHLLSTALLLLGSLERLPLPSLAALPTHSPALAHSIVVHRDVSIFWCSL
jgi:hypothetical protein